MWTHIGLSLALAGGLAIAGGGLYLEGKKAGRNEQIAKQADEELKTAQDPARKRVLNTAKRDVQSLRAFLAACAGGFGDPERGRVGCEGARRAAKQVARKLVEQDQQREAGARLAGPTVELSTPRPLPQRAEALADQIVEPG